MTILTIGLFIISLGVCYLVIRNNTVVVLEDQNAVVLNRRGFIKRVLPTGVHWLKPGLEKIEFTFETKTKLGKGIATDIPTAEGILLNVNWSGTYNLNAGLITEKTSQHLRGLPSAAKDLQHHVDLALRRLVGAYTLQELFKPHIRERIERQLTESLKSILKPAGVALNTLNLQAIILPEAVSKALNQAQAIQTLDTVIRTSDAATRKAIIGTHEELIAWSSLIPQYERYDLSRPTSSQYIGHKLSAAKN